MDEEYGRRRMKRAFARFMKIYNKYSQYEFRYAVTNQLYHHISYGFACPIARQQVKALVDKSSLDVKFLFNVFFDFFAPQKRWFLEDPHESIMFPRSPCNAHAYYVHTICNLGFFSSSTFVNCFPETIFAKKLVVLIADDICQVTLQWPENEYFVQLAYLANTNSYVRKHNGNFFTVDQINLLRPYLQKRTFLWFNGILTLYNDNKIRYNGREVTILLEGDVTNAKIMQMHVKDWNVDGRSRVHIIILFESWFLASGEIFIEDNQLTIRCQEIPGSYPTAFFAVSDTFNMLVRMTQVQTEIPDDCPTPNYDRFRHAVYMLGVFQRDRPDMFYHGNLRNRPHENYSNRNKYLPLFCEDMFFIVNAHESTSFSEPDLFLSEREKLICRFHRFKADEDSGRVSWSCLSQDGFCSNLTNFVRLAVTISTKSRIPDVVMTEKEKNFIQIMTHMSETILYILSDNISQDQWILERQLQVEKVHQRLNYQTYFPINAYERMNSLHTLSAEMDIADMSTVQKYIRTQDWRAVALLLFHRPDILCFSPAFVRDFRENLFPLHLIKKFSKYYPEIRRGGISDERKNEIINALADWMPKREERPVEPLPRFGSKYKKKKRVKKNKYKNR